jgi:hypothetical protein
MRDSSANWLAKKVLASVSGAGDNTAQVGAIIDRLGFDSLLFLINTGTLADADVTFTVLVEDGDVANLSDAAAVTDAELIGQDAASATAPEGQAGFQFDDDGEVRKIGYRGNKRYVRMTITPANNTGAWPIGVVALLGHAEQKPPIQGAT